MANLQNEVRLAVLGMLDNLKTMAEKNPDTPIRGAYEDFNALLVRAKEAFPNSRTIKEMKRLGGSISLAELVAKLSALKGAITAELDR